MTATSHAITEGRKVVHETQWNHRADPFLLVILTVSILFVIWWKLVDLWLAEQIARCNECIAALAAGWPTAKIRQKLPLPTRKRPWYVPRGYVRGAEDYPMESCHETVGRPANWKDIS